MDYSSLSADIKLFWATFLQKTERKSSTTPYGAFYFADTKQDANELASLVLSRIKRATASLLWEYKAERQNLPVPGNFSILTDWDGKPLCVLETVEVSIIPFEDVDEEFARIEGEGDGSLAYWREAHWAFFARECARLGREPSVRMPIVCEKFTIVYEPSKNTNK
ncbi:MAG: ASCH domain-containing protein [Cyanobacteria bacterium P01_H01_bin.15]